MRKAKRTIANYKKENKQEPRYFIYFGKKWVWVMEIVVYKTKPVFMNGKDGKEFWVRWTASTRQMVGVEEIVNYCLEHWGKKD